jgi:hypothetical protein
MTNRTLWRGRRRIDQPHQRQVLGGLPSRQVVPARSVHVRQFALAPDADLRTITLTNAQSVDWVSRTFGNLVRSFGNNRQGDGAGRVSRWPTVRLSEWHG